MRQINTRSKMKVGYKSQKFKNYFFPIAGAFFIISGVFQWENLPWITLGNVAIGLLYIAEPFWKRNTNYITFTEDYIEYPSGKLFGKAKKQLNYKDIEQAVYLVGDFIFRNKEQEVRLVKEFLKEEDIRFLEEKLVELNSMEESEKN